MEPDVERREAFVAAYFAGGSQKNAAAIAGVHIDTAGKWCRSPWFEKAMRDLKRARDKGLDGRITRILDKALDQLEERIEKGDQRVVVVGRGEHAHTEVENVPVPARDLAIITGVLFDKRAAIRREPENDDTQVSALERIADKLREVAREQKALKNDEAVDVEAHEVVEDDNSDLI